MVMPCQDAGNLQVCHPPIPTVIRFISDPPIACEDRISTQGTSMPSAPAGPHHSDPALRLHQLLSIMEQASILFSGRSDATRLRPSLGRAPQVPPADDQSDEPGPRSEQRYRPQILQHRSAVGAAQQEIAHDAQVVSQRQPLA